MRKTTSKWVAVTAVALLLAGCGSAKLPTTPKKLGAGSLSQRPAQGLLTDGAPQAQNALTGNADGVALLAATRQMMPKITGFDAQVKTFSQGNYKQGERVSELRKSTTETRLTWMKPLKLRAEVIQTTNSLLVGAAMATTDGKNVRVRIKGLLGLIPISLSITDPKLGNNRNHTLPESEPNAQLTRLTGQSAVWTVLGDQVFDGQPYKVVQIDNVQRLEKAITKEILIMHPQSLAIRKLIMFTGETKVIEHDMIKFKWNPKVADSSFEL